MLVIEVCSMCATVLYISCTCIVKLFTFKLIIFVVFPNENQFYSIAYVIQFIYTYLCCYHFNPHNIAPL